MASRLQSGGAVPMTRAQRVKAFEALHGAHAI
jgi:hypothetical protein